jgi:hypothetical protein
VALFLAANAILRRPVLRRHLAGHREQEIIRLERAKPVGHADRLSNGKTMLAHVKESSSA